MGARVAVVGTANLQCGIAGRYATKNDEGGASGAGAGCLLTSEDSRVRCLEATDGSSVVIGKRRESGAGELSDGSQTTLSRRRDNEHRATSNAALWPSLPSIPKGNAMTTVSVFGLHRLPRPASRPAPHRRGNDLRSRSASRPRAQHCLRSVQVADRQTARRSPARSRLGGSDVVGQSYRADPLRGRGQADGAAPWVHQEDTADNE